MNTISTAFLQPSSVHTIFIGLGHFLAFCVIDVFF